MKIVYLNFIIFFCCLSSVLAQIQKKDIAKKGIAATVTIIALDADNDPFQFGSGFVFNNEMVATNFHVIEGCKSVLITTSLDTVAYYSNELINFDKNNDIAILKVNSLSIMPLSLSKDTVEIGDAIYVVGNPEGLESTFSEGIVSSIRKYDDNKLIQITAPISHGSSGGPVINEKGEVIGISVATLKEGQNLNFAVPVEYLIKIKDIKVKPTLLGSEILKEIKIVEEEKPKIESKDLQMSLDFYNKGWEEYSNGNYDKAITYYKKAIHFDSACHKCYDKIAACQIALKDYKAARQNDYMALKIIKPVTEQDFIEQAGYIQDIGVTYGFEYNFSEFGRKKSKEIQLGIWDSLITMNPLPRYYNERAEIKLHNLADYVGALEDFMVMYENDNYPGSHLLWDIAVCYSSLENDIQAIQFYNKVIETRTIEYRNMLSESKLDKIYKNRGDCKTKLEDYRGAIDDYKLAISFHPKLDEDVVYIGNQEAIVPIYNSLAYARLSLNDYQNALTDLNKCLSIVTLDGFEPIAVLKNGKIEVEGGNEDLGYTYYLLGVAKINLNDKEGACRAWSKSGELGGSSTAYDAIKENCK
jgi:tetratricopeptide (TPR) repeat protein